MTEGSAGRGGERSSERLTSETRRGADVAVGVAGAFVTALFVTLPEIVNLSESALGAGVDC